MFHTLINAAYVIPNIYVFFRLRSFFNKKDRVKFTVIYLLIALIYPLGNLLPVGEGSGFSEIIMSFSEYLLAFYLYLFLFVLLHDLFLLIILKFRIVEREKTKTYRYHRVVIRTILLSSLSVVIAGIINFNTIRVSDYSIELPRESSKLDHLKIAFVADFHLQETTNKGFIENFVMKINRLGPDIVIFGGDIVEGNTSNKNLEWIEMLISGINTKYGVFGVLGNHERYSESSENSFFEGAKIILLNDSIVKINGSFYLGGRIDSRFRNRKNLNDLLLPEPDSLPFILIDHRPTELDLVSETNVDVQFSGHTHNGQMFPINLIIRKIYELSKGYRKIGNTHFFVTSGIRLWGPHVRTAGKSEIMVVDISFK